MTFDLKMTLNLENLFVPIVIFINANIIKMDIATHYYICLSNIVCLSIIDLCFWRCDLDNWNNCPCQFSACINDSLLKIDIITHCVCYIRLRTMGSLDILDLDHGPVTFASEVCPYKFSVCIKTSILKINMV